MINSEEEGINREEFLEKLTDAGRALADVQFQLSEARRAFIIPCFSKSLQEVLKKGETRSHTVWCELPVKIKTVKDSDKLFKEAITNKALKSQSSYKNTGNFKRLFGTRPLTNRAGFTPTGGQARPGLFFRRRLPKDQTRNQGQWQKTKNFKKKP